MTRQVYGSERGMLFLSVSPRADLRRRRGRFSSAKAIFGNVSHGRERRCATAANGERARSLRRLPSDCELRQAATRDAGGRGAARRATRSDQSLDTLFSIAICCVT